eukprot:4575221-Pyramimonas_sp.AAC.1
MEDEDRRALVRYLRRTCTRRAYPSWGLPSDMALLIEKPLESMADPNEASVRVAARLQRIAEAEEEEDMPQTNNGRSLLMKMGWRPGSAIGADPDGRPAEV